MSASSCESGSRAGTRCPSPERWSDHVARALRHCGAVVCLAAVAALGALADPARPVAATPTAAAQSTGTLPPGVENSCAPLDVVLLVDSTGSMRGVIDKVEAGLSSFVDRVERVSGGDYRIAVVEIGTVINVATPFAPRNADTAQRALGSLGQDGESRAENWDEALKTAVDSRAASAVPSGQQRGDFTPAWRDGVQKIVVLVTDARPAGFDDEYQQSDLDAAESTAVRGGQRGIRIGAFFVPNDNQEPEGAEMVRRVAERSGGAFFRTARDGSNISDGLDLLIETCARDKDGDGLWDTWETRGYDVNGDGDITDPEDLDLPTMGASPEHKDLFLQVNWFGPSGKPCWGLPICFWRDAPPRPRKEYLQRIVDAFNAVPEDMADNPDGQPGIRLHIDAGPETPAGGVRAEFRKGGPLPEDVPELEVADPGNPLRPAVEIFDRHVPVSRRHVFTWALHGRTLKRGDTGNLGKAFSIPSDGFVVAGDFLGSDAKASAVYMHELGHTLGLRHGGDDELLYKPNHLSVMNYSYVFNGGMERDGDDRAIDYSRWTLQPLNELSLQEPDGVFPLAGSPAPDGYDLFRYCGSELHRFRVSQSTDWDCVGGADGRDVKAVVRYQRRGAKPSQPAMLGPSINEWRSLIFTGGRRGGLDAEGEAAEEEGFTEDEYQSFPREHSVEVSGPSQGTVVAGSRRIALVFQARNTSINTDTYVISLAGVPGAEGDPSGPPGEVTLEPGTGVDLAVEVPLPAELPPEGARFTLTATSKAQPSATATGETLIVSTNDAPTVEPAGDLELDPSTATPGDTVSVSGSGFAPGGPVAVWLDTKSDNGLVTVTADADGKVSADVDVPTNIRRSTTMRAAGQAPGADPATPPRVLEARLTIELREDASSPTSRGGTPALLVLAGALLGAVLLGGAAVLLTRPRRSEN